MKTGFKELIVYKKAFALAMDIYRLSSSFPNEEKYSLCDQIRRSTRSICSNIGEAYRKRQYIPYFISKISDADIENTETQIWLDFALACKFISVIEYNALIERSHEIGRMLNYMIQHPEKYQIKS
ncbi:MAG: four helix bundle protein [Bacteroidetes bacterium]|nr:four helix bundle protein [Bacteroidota bacterium]